MNVGPRRDLRNALRTMKASITLLRNALLMPSLTPTERALIEAEKMTLEASRKRLRRVLVTEETTHVS